ncbi:MAG: DUF3857 domain-containing protein [Deltaproteobacteria bacterium]
MPIINIAKKGQKMHKYISIPVIFSCLFLSLSGCAQKSSVWQAEDYVSQSQNYYQRAVQLYKDLISRRENADDLRIELGKLYYGHGEFGKAIEELKNIESQQARKFLAFSYYRLGNFTDALDIFNRNKISDDEYLYYYGMTCEKLNLFDRALDIYKKISGDKFSALALERINIIEKQTGSAKISDIDPHISAIIEHAPEADKYPQAGALILLADERFQVTPQDTQVAELHYVIKVLNERGKESFSESHIDYDSTYEKVELEYARTIRPDGTVTQVGSRHIRDVSKYLNFPLYSNARVYIISFPEISEGAVIEYKLKIYRSELINKKDFVLNYPVQSSEPIIAADFMVEVPENKPVNIKMLNEQYNNFSANLKPDIQKNNGRVIYSWSFKDIPQIVPEANMPPGVEINPNILISTFVSWKQIYDWWWALAKDKIKAEAPIKEKVKELTENQPTEEAKIRAIYNFCARQIRYVAVEYGQAGYEPHKAEDIFRNKYGDCKDKAVLLVTMLREAGLTAWPVLISTRDYYNLNPDFPSMLFDHSIAAVSQKDKIVFLDATAETCAFQDLPPADQKRRVLVFKEEGYAIESTPLFPAGHNLVEQTLHIKINSDETIDAEKKVFTLGMYDQAERYWLLYTPPELVGEKLKERIQDIAISASLKSYKVENLDDLNKPVTLSYLFRGSEYLTDAGKLRIMPQLSGLDTSIVAKDKRKYPLDFGALDVKETETTIEIPKDFSVKYLPENATEDNPWMKFSAEYARKSEAIYFRQMIELKVDSVDQAQYPEFKAAFENLAKKIKQRVVLERAR